MPDLPPPPAIVETVPWSHADQPGGVLRATYRSPADDTGDVALFRPGGEEGVCVVYLHGHGADETQLYTRRDVREAWLPVLLALRVAVLSPRLRGNAWMGPAAVRDLAALLAWVRREQGGKRILLLGGSMGGTGALAYAVLRPDDVDAAVVLGGATDLAAYYDGLRARPPGGIHRELAEAIRRAYGGTPAEAAEVYADRSALLRADRLAMPVFLAHGAADPVMPVEPVRRLGALLEAKENGSAYLEIPGGGHDAPLDRTEAVAWLEARVRKWRKEAATTGKGTRP